MVALVVAVLVALVVRVLVALVVAVLVALVVAVLVALVVAVVVGLVCSHPANVPSRYESNAAFNTATVSPHVDSCSTRYCFPGVTSQLIDDTAVPREYSVTIDCIATVALLAHPSA